MTQSPIVYASEADLCAETRPLFEAAGWDVYPEVGGWDLLLVMGGNASSPPAWLLRGRSFVSPEPGFQVGVEAKLRPGLKVLAQVCDRVRYYPRGAHPNAAAILVPRRSSEFKAVCDSLQIEVVTPQMFTRYPWHFAPAPRWPGSGLKLPEVALQGSGGEASPRVMSAWRHGALRLCRRLREVGYLTGVDFKAEAVNQQRWLDATWIVRDGNDGAFARYVAGPRLDRDGPEKGYEAEAAALALFDSKKK